MAEFDTIWHGVKGPKLDSLVCKEKLYTLASLFFASPRIAALASDEVGCPFRQMLDEHEESLIVRWLIETAVLIRMKDDLYQQQHGIPADTHKDIVGILRIPTTATATAPLSLRDACNKIIHAKQINFDIVTKSNLHHERHLQPIIYVYGEQRGIQWKAELDIVKWVEFGYTMFP